MKPLGSPKKMLLRLVTALGLLCAFSVQADEYSDVSQLARSGKLPEAMRRAEQFLAAQPKDPQMRFLKGVIQRDSGKTADAIGTFTRITEDYPELPEPYNNLAVLYAGQSQFDKARSALEMAIRTNPSYATAHENLGDIYAKLASQAYNKALQLDGSNQAVAPKLALIREIFGNNKAQRPTSPASAAALPAASASVPAPAAKPAIPPVVAPAPVAPAPVASASVPPQPPKPAPAATQTPPPAPATTPPPTAAATKDVEAAVAAWARAWSARDVKAYLAAYGKVFNPPGSMGRKAWEEERQLRISSKASISVKVDMLRITASDNRATAKFRQDYKAGGLAVNSSKTLELTKVGDRWLIVKETVGN